MGTLTFLLRRLGQATVVVVGLVLITFVLTRLVVNPVNLMLGPESSVEQREALSEALGLNAPILTQLADYIVNALRGDLGVSVWHNVPALPLVLERLPASLLLGGAATAIAIVIGLALGVAGGLRPGSLIDRVATGLTVLSVAIPEFWLGILLIVVFAVHFHWLPTAGYGGAKHLVLPALTLSLHAAGRIAQLARTSISQEMLKQYVVAAKARGLTRRQYLVRHVFKNCAVPMTTIIGFDFIRLFAGAGASVEVVFGWPGIGQLAVQAALQQDVVLVTALVLVTGSIVSVGYILLDMLHAVIDRRISV